MDSSSWMQLFILLLLLILSGFFSSAETSLTTVNRLRIRSLCEEGNKRAITLQKILDHYSKMLSAILIGNNIVNISASSLATTLTIHIWGNYAVGIATGVLTLLVLICGEIVPKTWAALYAEKIALSYSPIIYLLMTLLTPVIFIIDKLADLLFMLFRIDRNASTAAITENELKTIVDVSHEGGIIESEEREMIYNVFDFSDALAKDIMIPRIDLVTVNSDASYQELLEIVRESMYTRIPVYETSSDNMIGIVNVKDLFMIDQQATFQVKDILREAYYTYEYKKTADLLIEMREKTSNVAFVLNEYGATVGLITLEDLLEEIVGEIRDEYDDDEDEFIQEIGDNEYLIDGNMKIDDINDALDCDIESEDYDSIGGLMIELLEDRLPEEGEQVYTPDGDLIRADKVNDNRIEKVYLRLSPKYSDEADLITSTLSDDSSLSN